MGRERKESFFPQSPNISNCLIEFRNYYNCQSLSGPETFFVTMEARTTLGSKNVTCSVTCFSVGGGRIFTHCRIEIQFFYSGTHYKPNFTSGLWDAPAKTDSPTRTCQSRERVRLSPSVECGRGPGRLQAGLGVRLRSQTGAKRGFSGT